MAKMRSVCLVLGLFTPSATILPGINQKVILNLKELFKNRNQTLLDKWEKCGILVLILATKGLYTLGFERSAYTERLEAGRDKILSSFFCFGGLMSTYKKEEKSVIKTLPNETKIKVNVLSPDGRMFYIETDDPKYYSPSLLETEDIRKAVPFVGKETSQRCPYCTSRECLKNRIGSGRNLNVIPHGRAASYRPKVKSYSVEPYECLKWKLKFVVERLSNIYLDSMALFDKKCPRCHAPCGKELTYDEFFSKKFESMSNYELFKDKYHFFWCNRCGEEFAVSIRETGREPKQST